MSDLRTRIAAVIYNACDDYTRKLMVRPDCPGASEVEGDGTPVCYVLADAVIRELDADYILVPKGHTIARIRSAEKLGLTGDGE